MLVHCECGNVALQGFKIANKGLTNNTHFWALLCEHGLVDMWFDSSTTITQRTAGVIVVTINSSPELEMKEKQDSENKKVKQYFSTHRKLPAIN